MKKLKIIVPALYILIIAVSVASIMIAGQRYTLFMYNPTETDCIEIKISDESVAKTESITTKNGITKIVFKGLKKGEAEIASTYFPDPSNKNIKTTYYLDLKVTSALTTMTSGYDFGGYQFISMGFALLNLLTVIIFILQFRYRKEHLFFNYKTVLDLAMIFYFGTQFFIFAAMFCAGIIVPERFDSIKMFDFTGLTMSIIFTVTLPAAVLFSLFLCISNLSLIRHEGFRKNNLFGILISAFMAFGAVVCIITTVNNLLSTYGSIEQLKYSVIRSIVASCFVYFECILFSTQLCILYASRFKPSYYHDYIIILGCKIKKDGTPLPLLRGRIDRAIEFYKKQLEATGKKAVFIPSGGQGSDEVMPEALSMKNYLIENGIDEDSIIPETESATTLQNMLYSKKIINSRMENANTLFVTTNYHIFRSGMYAAQADFPADGIGAKTKWYFWPNAQIREFIGILAKEWKINLIFVVLTALTAIITANLGTILYFIFK